MLLIGGIADSKARGLEAICISLSAIFIYFSSSQTNQSDILFIIDFQDKKAEFSVSNALNVY